MAGRNTGPAFITPEEDHAHQNGKWKKTEPDIPQATRTLPLRIPAPGGTD